MTTWYKARGCDTRMLVSHNFDITDPGIRKLSRGNFTEYFVQGLDVEPIERIAFCQLIENPHWVFEIQFDGKRFTPQEMGDIIIKTLIAARTKETPAGIVIPQAAALGGLKQTEAANDSRNTLQINEWGVDVIETPDVDAFLENLGWEATIAQREPGTTFQSVWKG